MFLETSALTGENINESFHQCARIILSKIASGCLFFLCQFSFWSNWFCWIFQEVSILIECIPEFNVTVRSLLLLLLINKRIHPSEFDVNRHGIALHVKCNFIEMMIDRFIEKRTTFLHSFSHPISLNRNSLAWYSVSDSSWHRSALIFARPILFLILIRIICKRLCFWSKKTK